MSFEAARTGSEAHAPAVQPSFPPELVLECMGQLETLLHLEGMDLPLLVRAALVHAQFF